jgi:hypothetical protein
MMRCRPRDRYTQRLRDGPGPAVHRFAIARAAPHPGHVTPYLSAFGVKPGHDVARTRHLGMQPFSQRRLASTLSQIIAATSGPPSAFTARMPVGDVTLISVR